MEPDEQKGFTTLLNSAFFYLGLRSRTMLEMRRYLRKRIEKKKLPEELIEQVMNRLKELNYLNDLEYTQNFVRNQLIIKPQSVFALKQRLMRKGISKQIIDDYFADADVNEEQGAKELAVKAWRKYSREELLKRKQKTLMSLVRKGFSYDIAKKMVALVEEKEYNIH